MQQADKAVPAGNFLHHFHRELVLVGSYVSGGINHGKFMLGRGNLVVLCFGIDAELPELLVQFLHISLHTRLDGSEIVVVQLLAFGRFRAEKCSSGVTQILALQKHFPVYQEVFLFRPDIGRDSLYAFIAEEFQNSQCLTVDSLHTPQQGSLLIQRLPAVGTECRRDAERFFLDKRIAGWIPGSVSSGFKRCAQAAGRKRRCIRLTLDQFLSGKFHDGTSVRRRIDKAVMFLGSNARQRLKPVCKMCSSVLHRPGAHGRSHRIGKLLIQRRPFLNGPVERLIDVLRQSGTHHFVIKDFTGKYFGYAAHNPYLLFF